jgi:hypothetical protein
MDLNGGRGDQNREWSHPRTAHGDAARWGPVPMSVQPRRGAESRDAAALRQLLP